MAKATKPKGTVRRKPKPVPIVTSTVEWKERAEGAPHMVGYARVSMSDQNNQRQIDELVRAGVHVDDIFTDQASGKSMDRPGWQACWKDLQPGDILVIDAVDRLGRDLLQVCTVLEELHKKDVNLKVLRMDLDSRTIMGKFAFIIMAAFAEVERRLIQDRSISGMARARERGRIGGRAPLHSHRVILAAAEQHGVNAAGPLLDPPLQVSSFKKALARAREWQREQEVGTDD